LKGEEMTHEQAELHIRKSFNKYCKKTLCNEAINAHVASKRRKNIVVNFSDIAFNEEVWSETNHFPYEFEKDYAVKGKSISCAQLSAAINRLAAPYRKVVELYYFYELNDRIISEIIQIPRSTVQSWRSKALILLRDDLEDNSDVCNTDF